MQSPGIAGITAKGLQTAIGRDKQLPTAAVDRQIGDDIADERAVVGGEGSDLLRTIIADKKEAIACPHPFAIAPVRDNRAHILTAKEKLIAHDGTYRIQRIITQRGRRKGKECHSVAARQPDAPTTVLREIIDDIAGQTTLVFLIIEQGLCTTFVENGQRATAAAQPNIAIGVSQEVIHPGAQREERHKGLKQPIGTDLVQLIGIECPDIAEGVRIQVGYGHSTARCPQGTARTGIVNHFVAAILLPDEDAVALTAQPPAPVAGPESSIYNVGHLGHALRSPRQLIVPAPGAGIVDRKARRGTQSKYLIIFCHELYKVITGRAIGKQCHTRHAGTQQPAVAIGHPGIAIGLQEVPAIGCF